jgi:hypothetical protein
MKTPLNFPTMIKLLSRLPWWVLYGLSWFIYFLAYYVVRHRQTSSASSWPRSILNLTDTERKRIHRRFLKNFCDVLVEVLKSVSMSAEDMRSRVRIAESGSGAALSRCGPIRHVRHIASVQLGVAAARGGAATGFPVDAGYKPCTISGRNG